MPLKLPVERSPSAQEWITLVSPREHSGCRVFLSPHGSAQWLQYTLHRRIEAVKARPSHLHSLGTKMQLKRWSRSSALLVQALCCGTRRMGGSSSSPME